MSDQMMIDPVLSDRGSKYAVSGAQVSNKADVQAYLKQLKRKKKFAKATHNSWGVIFADGTQLKSDDGEAGAGMVILRVLEGAGATDQLVVVTRWFGGVHLGGDRFRHVKTATQEWLRNFLAP